MRRRRGLLLILLVALIVGGGVVIGFDAFRRQPVVGSIPWRLVDVSADARSFTIEHEIPHCTTEPGDPVVRQDATQVNVTIPEVRTEFGFGEVACTADLMIGRSTVRLAAALGRRDLRRPARRGGTTSAFATATRDLSTRACAALRTLPAEAPAREVRWIARRLRACTADLPTGARRLPLLLRPRTRADRLPDGFREMFGLDGRVARDGPPILRPDLARRFDADGALWFIPGPVTSCIGRIRDGEPSIGRCARTATVGRRGLFVATTCAQRTPKYLSLVGIVPAGVDAVGLTPRRGRARSARVVDGVWSARAAHPVVITYGAERFRTGYETRACY